MWGEHVQGYRRGSSTRHGQSDSIVEKSGEGSQGIFWFSRVRVAPATKPPKPRLGMLQLTLARSRTRENHLDPPSPDFLTTLSL